MSGACASVLVVDDEAGMREMLCYELSQEGFSVEAADSGLSAVDAMRRKKFDLVVTDLKMPGMDGLETVRALRDLDPDVEVIVGTGYATVETAVECMKRGAYDYIQKPYDLRELTILLKRALEKSHLQGVVALYEVSRVLLETLQQTDVLRLATSLSARALDADVVELVLDVGFGNRDLDHGGTAHAELIDGLVALTEETGAPVRFPNSAEHAPKSLGQFASALILPLNTRRKAIGHLVVLRSTGRRAFTEGDLKRGTVLGNQLALSLDNARLYDDLARRLEELSSARKQLAQSEKLAATARFASYVAHEINNPLASVQGNLCALREYSVAATALAVAAQEVAQYLAHAATSDDARRLRERLLDAAAALCDSSDAEAAGQVAETIDDVLDGVRRISQLVADFGDLAAEPEPGSGETVDVRALVDECLAGRTDQAPWARKLSQVPRVWGIRHDIEVALQNVLAFVSDERARRGPHSGGARRSISVRACNGGAVISVEDPELTIPEAERDILLEPRVHAIPSARGRLGLDMGMAVAHRLLDRNGGRLAIVDGEPGTAVRLELPSQQGTT